MPREVRSVAVTQGQIADILQARGEPTGASVAFPDRPLSDAFRPFIGPIMMVCKGSKLVELIEF